MAALLVGVQILGHVGSDFGFAPGERIDAEQLAEQLMTSITPTRASLHQRVGQGLIAARAGKAFTHPW